MTNLFLKFPPLLGGNGDASAYLVLLLIVAFVGFVLYFVFRLLNQDASQ